MTQKLRGLLRKLPRNNQKGFTLIELLVVISILGILAAVVTMSMVGLTNLAHANANDAERHTVQIALDTMATKDEIPLSSVCPPTGGATTDMTTFPSSAHALSPKYLRQGQTAKSYTCTGEGLVVQS